MTSFFKHFVTLAIGVRVWKDHDTGIVSVHRLRILRIFLKMTTYILKQRLFWLYFTIFNVLCTIYFIQLYSVTSFDTKSDKIEHSSTERDIDKHSESLDIMKTDIMKTSNQLRKDQNEVLNVVSAYRKCNAKITY